MIQDLPLNILQHRWTRLVVMLLVLATLAYQISILFWSLYPLALDEKASTQAIIRNNTTGVTQPGFLQQAELISRVNLFGVKKANVLPVVEAEVAPQTKLNYKLRGIYYSTVDRLSSAIVEIAANKSQPYQLDDELAENITLAKIEPDHIIINRYGKLERLNLQKPINSKGGLTIGNRSTGQAASQQSINLLKSYKRRYVSNPLALAKRFQAIPVQSNGQNIGFKLKALRGESLLKKLNFQESDVFTKINGIGLDKPFQALDALKSLSTASNITVTIMRNGNEQTMNFNL